MLAAPLLLSRPAMAKQFRSHSFKSQVSGFKFSMIPLLTSSPIRALDAHAVDKTGIPGMRVLL
jgi:hypothetical protein